MIVDYQDFTTINTPKDRRRELNVGDIYSNGVVCKKCGEYIRSKNRHDFVVCGCGAVGIDGGSWYCRLIGKWENFDIKTIYFRDVGANE